ncbi:ATP-grasp domain-containing protein [Oerskovia enterophila]|uniref:ATP-grasp domain-containing protein n=1 Tax=Oerskovia enterophila TaxID=43678 RepID=UPI0033912CAE
MTLTSRIAVATCSVLPHLDPDDAPLVGALAARGIEAVPSVWDDETVDWTSFDAVVVRSAWDYAPRRDEFVEWAERAGRVLNPAAVISWNTDKRYLRELEEQGVPVIPTLWLDPSQNLSSRAIHTRLPAQGDFVIKPVVSAGAKDTGRYQSGEAHSRGLAIQHAKNLLVSGRQVMVQPYVRSVDTAGETGLVFIDGEFSHAVRKNALLTGPHRPTQGLYKQEEMSRFEASPEQLEVAQQALAVAAKAVPGQEPNLYARVDLVGGDDGAPMVIEVELTEPSLFFSLGKGSLDRFADAVAQRLVAAPTA